MPVDITTLLHVLPPELPPPAATAQRYLRMLLEDRLTEAADQRRAIEQTQKAVARVSELTLESSRLARWLDEQHDAPRSSIDAHVLVTRVASNAGIEPLRAKVDVSPASI